MSKRAAILAGSTATVVAGLSQLVGDTVYALDRVYPGDPGFAFANIVALTWHIVFVAGVLGLAADSRDVLGRTGRVGTALAVVGLGLLIAAEVVTQIQGSVPIPLIAASAPVAAIGLVLAGAALTRAGGRHRGPGLAALLAGGYAAAVIVPTSIDANGANYFVIAGWGACWALLGVSVLASSGTRASAPAVEAG